MWSSTPPTLPFVGGGGVDGAIHRAAGRKLLEACRQLGRATPGSAVTTPGFNLVARHVVHAVGPVWQDGDSGEPEQLGATYSESLKRADEVGANLNWCLPVSVRPPDDDCDRYGHVAYRDGQRFASDLLLLLGRGLRTL